MRRGGDRALRDGWGAAAHSRRHHRRQAQPEGDRHRQGRQKLKVVATQARKDMEKLFGGKVFLEVWVKVKSGWADSAATLKRMGFDS